MTTKQARICKTIQSPTQSGRADPKWVIYFTHAQKTIDPTMGWSASDDTMPQIKIQFGNLSDAVKFARDNGWDAEIIEPRDQRRVIKKTYADNFVD